MCALAALLALAAVLVAATTREPAHRGTLDDLRADAVYVLRQCPGVADVERTVSVNRPKHRIVHIVDLHWVKAGELAADRVAFEGAANDAREAAIVRRLLDAGPLAVVVFGAAHDLSRHVGAAGDAEYLRVFVEGWPE